MYDTVCFKLGVENAEGVNLIENVPKCLDAGGVSYHEGEMWRYISGKLKGEGGCTLDVVVSDRKLKLSGSVCKWYWGDNVRTLQRHDMENAVKMLSERLQVPLWNADITRLDIGDNLFVKKPVKAYLSHLGEYPRYSRLMQPSGLYYTSNTQDVVLSFYDKRAEVRNAGGKVDELFKGYNILRYELRYKRHLQRHLKEERVTAALLYEERFYMKLLDLWRAAYDRISKVNDVELNVSAMRKRSDLYRAGVLSLVERFGGETAVLQQLKMFQQRGDLTRKQAYDLKAAVRSACKERVGFAVQNKEIEELNRAVAGAIMYYR